MKGFRKYVVVCAVLAVLLPVGSNAQMNNAPLVHLLNLMHDEDGDLLHWSGSVFAEPFMNEIYVIDGSQRIMIYTADLFPIFTIDKGNGLESPLGLTVDEKGYIYVIQSPARNNSRYRISVFNPILEWERDIYPEGFEGADDFKPSSIDIDKLGNMYLTGLGVSGVLVLDNAGRYQEVIAHVEGEKIVEVNYVRVKGDRIYLVSAVKGKIYVYDSGRTFLFQFGAKGGAPRHLSTPVSVDADPGGNIYVVDYMRHVVLIYNDKGLWLAEFGGLGWGDSWFQHPRSVSIDTAGRVFVADLMNNRIQVFRPIDIEKPDDN